MEKTFSRTELLDVLEKAKFGIAPKEEIEQSQSFIFDNDRVYTYNDNIGVSVPFKTGLKCAVPSLPLLTLLRKLKKDDIILSFQDGALSVRQGKRVAVEITANADIILPFDSKIKPPKVMEKLSYGGAFEEGVKFCQFCVCDDTQRLQLCGVHIASDAKGTFIESTDRFRLVRRYISDEPAKLNISLPLDAAKALCQLEPVSCGASEGWLYFNCKGGVLFACWTPAEAYPDLLKTFDEVSSGGKAVKLEIPAKVSDILELATQFSIQTSAKDSRIVIKVENGRLTVSTTGLYGKFEEHCKIDSKASLTFALHPKTLAEYLAISHKINVVNESFMYVRSKKYWHLITLDVHHMKD